MQTGGNIAQVMAWLYSKLEVSAIWITSFDLNFNERFFYAFRYLLQENGIKQLNVDCTISMFSTLLFNMYFSGRDLYLS